jgi:hypothetical protein
MISNYNIDNKNNNLFEFNTEILIVLLKKLPMNHMNLIFVLIFEMVYIL